MKKYLFLVLTIICLPVFAQSPVGAQNIEPQNVQPQNVQPQNIQQAIQGALTQDSEKPQQQEVTNQSSPTKPQVAVKEENEASIFSTIIGFVLTLLVFVPPLLGSFKTRRKA